MKNANKRYIDEIKSNFPIYENDDKTFIEELMVRIDSFSENYPNASYDDYVLIFGLPSEIISEYYKNMSDNVLIHKINRNKTKSLLLFLLGLFLILTLTILFNSYLEGQDSYVHAKNYEITETE